MEEGDSVGKTASQVRANEDKMDTGIMLLRSTENMGGDCEVRIGDYSFSLEHSDCGDLKTTGSRCPVESWTY